MSERVTTIAAYESDLRWLRERQRKVSFERNKTVPMCDMVRELIQYIQQQEAGAGA
jgi:hypothetical protein